MHIFYNDYDVMTASVSYHSIHIVIAFLYVFEHIKLFGKNDNIIRTSQSTGNPNAQYKLDTEIKFR